MRLVVVIRDFSMMHTHQFCRKMQTDADAIVRITAAVETLEEQVLLGFLNPHSRIFYRYEQMLIGIQRYAQSHIPMTRGIFQCIR